MAVDPFPYVQFYVGHYLTDTAHLRHASQHGAYDLLMFNYWQRGGALPDDDRKLAGIAKLSDAEWKEMRPLIEEFFTVADGFWKHKRIEADLEKVRVQTNQAIEAGKAAARARAAKKDGLDPPPKKPRKKRVEQPLNDRSTGAERALNDRSTGAERTLSHKDLDLDTELVGDGDSARDRFTQIEWKCREAAGLTVEGISPSLADVSFIVGLMERGVNLDLDILPAIRASRPKKPVSSWKYFSEPITRWHSNRLAPLPAPIPFPNARAGPRSERRDHLLDACLNGGNHEHDGYNDGYKGPTIDATAERSGEGDSERPRSVAARRF